MKRNFKDGGWFRVHNRLLDQYAPEIGPNGIAIYCVMARCADNETQEIQKKTLDDIAELAGMGKSTVQKHLATLIDLGLVEIVTSHVPRKKTTVYRLPEIPERKHVPKRIIYPRPSAPDDGASLSWTIPPDEQVVSPENIPPDEQVIPPDEQVVPPDEQVVPSPTTLQDSSQYFSQHSSQYSSEANASAGSTHDRETSGNQGEPTGVGAVDTVGVENKFPEVNITPGVVMEPSAMKPWDAVRLFERMMTEAGHPKTFTGQREKAALKHAKELIAECADYPKRSVQETFARFIQHKDGWEAERNPNMAGEQAV